MEEQREDEEGHRAAPGEEEESHPSGDEAGNNRKQSQPEGPAWRGAIYRRMRPKALWLFFRASSCTRPSCTRPSSCTRSPQVWSVADAEGELAVIRAPRRQQFTQAVISQKRPRRRRRPRPPEESAILISGGARRHLEAAERSQTLRSRRSKDAFAVKSGAASSAKLTFGLLSCVRSRRHQVRIDSRTPSAGTWWGRTSAPWRSRAPSCSAPPS